VTEPTIIDIQGGPDMPPIRILDLGKQPSATPVEPMTASTWVEHGQPHSDPDPAEIRLNLSESGLRAFVQEQQVRVETAQRTLGFAHDRVRNEFGDLTHVETWEAVRKCNPVLYESVIAAEQMAEKLTRIVQMNVTAVERETSAAPIRLAARDEQRAATLLPLVERTVEKSTLFEIRDAFRLAIVNEDTANQYLFATLLPDRLRRAAQTRDDGNGVHVIRDGDASVRSELQAMVKTVRESMKDDSLTPIRTRAQGLKSGAGKIAHAAKVRRRAFDAGRSGLVRHPNW
jgi:hypothetical protein